MGELPEGLGEEGVLDAAGGFDVDLVLGFGAGAGRSMHVGDYCGHCDDCLIWGWEKVVVTVELRLWEDVKGCGGRRLCDFTSLR